MGTKTYLNYGPNIRGTFTKQAAANDPSQSIFIKQKIVTGVACVSCVEIRPNVGH